MLQVITAESTEKKQKRSSQAPAPSTPQLAIAHGSIAPQLFTTPVISEERKKKTETNQAQVLTPSALNASPSDLNNEGLFGELSLAR